MPVAAVADCHSRASPKLGFRSATSSNSRCRTPKRQPRTTRTSCDASRTRTAAATRSTALSLPERRPFAHRRSTAMTDPVTRLVRRHPVGFLNAYVRCFRSPSGPRHNRRSVCSLDALLIGRFYVREHRLQAWVQAGSVSHRHETVPLNARPSVLRKDENEAVPEPPASIVIEAALLLSR
jgi:hypothetical protein